MGRRPVLEQRVVRRTPSERLAWALLRGATGSTTIADDWFDSFAHEVLERRAPRSGPPGRGAILRWLDATP